MGLSLILVLLTILSIIYACSYANYEFKNKNKKGAMIIYIIALLCVLFSIIQILF